MSPRFRDIVTLSVIVVVGASIASGCFVTTTRDGRLAVVGVTPGVVVYSQPPPPRQVAMARPPSPHPQSVWVEGHWQWNGRQYVWVPGYWADYRPSYRYVSPRWERQGNGWVYYEGYYAPIR